jgi:hypothetical protein
MILAALSLIALLALVASIALVVRYVAFEQQARRAVRQPHEAALPVAA